MERPDRRDAVKEPWVPNVLELADVRAAEQGNLPRDRPSGSGRRRRPNWPSSPSSRPATTTPPAAARSQSSWETRRRSPNATPRLTVMFRPSLPIVLHEEAVVAVSQVDSVPGWPDTFRHERRMYPGIREVVPLEVGNGREDQVDDLCAFGAVHASALRVPAEFHDMSGPLPRQIQSPGDGLFVQPASREARADGLLRGVSEQLPVSNPLNKLTKVEGSPSSRCAGRLVDGSLRYWAYAVEQVRVATISPTAPCRERRASGDAGDVGSRRRLIAVVENMCVREVDLLSQAMATEHLVELREPPGFRKFLRAGLSIPSIALQR